MRGWRILALGLCALIAASGGETRAQSLTRDAFVWPPELQQEISCRTLMRTRDRYLQTPRQEFNCIAGVDCPEDLQPGAPAPPASFNVYYLAVDASRQPLDVELVANSFGALRLVMQRLIGDIDRVARSRRKRILVVGHAGQPGSERLQQEISEVMGQCITAATEIALQVNGYRGAYDFETVVEARGGSDTSSERRDDPSRASAFDRRVSITITY